MKRKSVTWRCNVALDSQLVGDGECVQDTSSREHDGEVGV